jgi:transposase-like protein
MIGVLLIVWEVAGQRCYILRHLTCSDRHDKTDNVMLSFFQIGVFQDCITHLVQEIASRGSTSQDAMCLMQCRALVQRVSVRVFLKLKLKFTKWLQPMHCYN